MRYICVDRHTDTDLDHEVNTKDKQVVVTQTDNIAFQLIRKVKTDTDLDNITFQLIRKVKTCNNLKIFETTEGFYLTIIRAYESWEGHKLPKRNMMIYHKQILHDKEKKLY